MCGRYSRSCETETIVDAFDVDEIATETFPAELMARHTVSDLVNSVHNQGPEVVATTARWNQHRDAD